MRKAVITVTLAIAVAIPYSAAIIQAQTQSAKTSVGNSTTAGNETTATIGINGMSCGSCAMQIQSTLAKTPGVKSADVSYEKKRAVVSYDAKTTSVDYWMHQLQGQWADTMLCLNPIALSSRVQKYLEAGK